MNDIAFGGAQGLLDRQAQLRVQEDILHDLWGSALVLPLWRGKVCYDSSLKGLAWLPPSHKALAGGGRIFLGKVGNVALFASDISAWQPASLAPDGQGFGDMSLQIHPDLPPHIGFADLRGVMTNLSALDGECAATAKALTTWHDTHRFCARCGGASDVTDAGWRRHCHACATSHFPRTDPVVIMLVTRGDHLLLGRSPGWPEGMYSLLAGFVEPGEVLEAAVRREVFEETGVRVGDVRYLASQPWPFPASMMLGAIARAETENITIDPAELEDAIWLNKQEVLQVQLGHNPKVKAGRKGAIAQHLIAEWLSGRIE